MLFDKYLNANLVVGLAAIIIFSSVIGGVLPGEFRWVGWGLISIQLLVLIVQITNGTMKRDLPSEFWTWFRKGLKKRPIFTGDIPDG